MKLRTRPVDALALHRLLEQGFDPLRARLFAARGIRDAQDCDLSLERLLRPRMLGLDRAAALMAAAIIGRKAIIVIGDFDCDGATGVATAVTGLRQMGGRTDYLVPSRFHDGYGLSPRVVDAAAAHPRLGRADLILTVDNGINALAGVERANALAIPVVITDHHLPGPQLPRAAAIVDPNQPQCPFPAKSIAGVGVMFYLLAAIRQQLRELGFFAPAAADRSSPIAQPSLSPLLDLVALGTVADVVALDHNNRRLVAAGLARIRAGRARPGIRALFEVAGRSPQRATTADLGYLIGPRINAAGRLADMALGIECLLADHDPTALALATQLDQLSRERREIESNMREQAEQIAVDLAPVRRSLVVSNSHWHQGVIGLVAARLKENHHRPCIALAPEVIGDSLGPLRGSGRSIPGLNLRDLLAAVDRRHPGLLLRFGGHAMAAGLTLAPGGRVTDLAHAFEEAVTQATAADASLFERELLTDGPLEPCELSLATVEQLEREVWGQGFAEPLFSGRFRILRQRLIQERHLKLVLEPADADPPLRAPKQRLEAIAFGRRHPLPPVAALAYRLQRDEYQALSRLSLVVLEVFEQA